ncbi:hypothetical protein FHS96_001348 [Sphingomonas zeicaulis]|uniref:DUF6894 family protein n=1 Tax=Sphingomonas zeicaulis TaxID=1632740 RepID=UPI003D257E2A
MPLFFFHLFERDDVYRDPVGSRMENLQAAKRAAARSLADIAGVVAHHTIGSYDGHIEIADESETTLCTVRLTISFSSSSRDAGADSLH